MGDRKLHLMAVAAPLTAALCLTACTQQEAKTPAPDETTAEAPPTELQPPQETPPTPPGQDQEPPKPTDDEVLPSSPPPPPPPPPLPTCPGDPRCEGKVVTR